MSTIHWLAFLLLLAVVFSHSMKSFEVRLSVIGSRFTKMSLYIVSLLMMLFMLHTMWANWDFIDFYEGKSSGNPLPYAKQNPYLAEQAWWIDMSAILYSSMQYGLKDNVRLYTEWGEKRLINYPDVDLFEKLTDAYQYLGDREHYCRIAYQGNAIFPHSDRLKTAVNFCRL